MPIRRARERFAKAWCWPSSPEFTGPAAGGLRLEDNFWITAQGNEKLCSFPDDFRLLHASSAKGSTRWV